MLGLRQAGALKRCNYCGKSLPLDAFGTRQVKGEDVVYSMCATCRPKNKANQKRYNSTEKGKAKAKRARSTENHKAAKKRYNSTEKGRACQKRCGSSEKGKASRKRYESSDKGKAARKRRDKARKARCAADPAFALKLRIASTASSLARGHHITSPTFVARTSFESEAHFREHLVSMLPDGYTMADYGKGCLDIEHRIPQEAYNFDDPEDVKRCWSPGNVRLLSSGDNNAKGITIIDEQCMEAGSEVFPAAWEGRLLTHDEKEAFYASHRAQWNAWLEEVSDAEEDEEYDEDEEEDDDEEEGDDEDDEDDE